MQNFVRKNMLDLIEDPIPGCQVVPDSLVVDLDTVVDFAIRFDVLIAPDSSSPYCDRTWRVRLWWKHRLFSERRVEFLETIFSGVVHCKDFNLLCENAFDYLTPGRSSMATARQMVLDVLRVVFQDPTAVFKSKWSARLNKYVQYVCAMWPR